MRIFFFFFAEVDPHPPVPQNAGKSTFLPGGLIQKNNTSKILEVFFFAVFRVILVSFVGAVRAPLLISGEPLPAAASLAVVVPRRRWY
ncbi:hypothetical protein [Schleiferilactobacillus harbinensis]|uniref:hypothetical protein n=1 Tax=Schleiferilactobacillus harbinensis TaxID=304207 RepID=UPI0004836DAF|nr:hypothetical protein [Schleiferilactobacillus harbinensis]